MQSDLHMQIARGRSRGALMTDDLMATATQRDPIDKQKPTKALIVCSGGLDSVTAAYYAAKDRRVALVSFDYGQRHVKELQSARMAAARLGTIPHRTITLDDVAGAIAGSSSLLTHSQDDVPDGHYAEQTMKSTVVPNRNAIMLTIAFGIAAAQGYDEVWTAVHGGDHYIYPDCRPDFISAFALMQHASLRDIADVRLVTPFISVSKADIVRIGAALHVPFADTWSCYKGGDVHCGACGTCFERREAFTVAEIDDPTQYEALPDYATPEGVTT
jgi:7-cyano-7-deazaguanine synthase